MKMLWTTIMVKNLDEESRFLKDVANIDLEYSIDNPRIGFFMSGETKLEIIESPDAKVYENLSFGIFEANLEEKRLVLENSGYNPSPIVSPNPGIKFFFVSSLSGYRIQFVNKLD